MPVLEMLTGAELGKIVVKTLVSKGMSAGGKRATELLTHLRSKTVPENHTIAKASHKAFLQSLRAIVATSNSACKNYRDRTALNDLMAFVDCDAVKTWGTQALDLPHTLDEQVRQIYANQPGEAVQAANESIIAFVEQAGQFQLTDTLKDIFRHGRGTTPDWAGLFEVFFAEAVKTDQKLFNILSIDAANEQRDMIARLVDLAESQVDTLVRLHSEIAASIATIEKAVARARPLPIGIRALGELRESDRHFREYLHSGRLRYFSRAAYAAETGAMPPFSESELCTQLSSGAISALVLSGPGGVGKTRLATELAGMLESDRDASWQAYFLHRNTAHGDVDAFIRGEPDDSRIALVIDYGETAANLTEIALSIEMLTRESPRRIALIVTCRSSALGQVRSALADLHPRVEELYAEADGGAFQRWVVRQIIASQPALENADKIIEVCRDIPVLAAFAVFLHARQPDQFDEQFGALVGLNDFDSWIDKRRRALLDATGATARDVAQTVLCLPMPRARHAALVDAGGTVSVLLEKLLADCWIEETAEELVAAHDVLADGLAAAWLLEAPRTATQNCRTAMRHAVQAGQSGAALEAINRLAAHPNFNAINGGQIVDEIRAAQAGALSECLGPLLNGNLLNFAEKMALLARDADLREAVAANKRYHSALSRLAEELGDQRIYDPPNPQAWLEMAGLLRPMIDSALGGTQRSNLLIRRAYHMDPEYYRAPLLLAIDDFPLSSQTHFPLVEMLKAGEEPSGLWPRIKRWLDSRADRDEAASFILRAWLENEGDLALIEPYAQIWLSHFAQTNTANFVISPWLRRNGDTETIWPFIERYTAKYAQDRFASHVYSAWILNGGDEQRITPYVKQWLAKNAASLHAWHLYYHWGLKDCDFSVVRQAMLDWLARETNAGREEARNVLLSWLLAGGGMSEIADQFSAWLAEHGNTPSAGLLYNAWIESGADLNEIALYALPWLQDFAETKEATYILRPWLERGGDYYAIEEYILRWLDVHHREYYAVFVTKVLSKQKNLTENAVNQIIVWCRLFVGDIDAPFRLTNMSAKIFRMSDMTKSNFVNACLICLDHQFEILNKNDHIRLINLSSVLGGYFNLIEDRSKARALLSRAFHSPGILANCPEWFRLPSGFENGVQALIRHRMFDPDENREFLRNMLKQLRLVSKGENRIGWFLDKVKDSCPNFDWDDLLLDAGG